MKFANYSIQNKLTVIIMLTSMMVAVFIGALVVGFSHVEHRKEVLRDLKGISNILGFNSQAALLASGLRNFAVYYNCHVLPASLGKGNTRGAQGKPF